MYNEDENTHRLCIVHAIKCLLAILYLLVACSVSIHVAADAEDDVNANRNDQEYGKGYTNPKEDHVFVHLRCTTQPELITLC